MNDPVDRLLVEREAVDRGFPAGVILSVSVHLVLLGGSLLAAVLTPATPPINVVEGMVVALPFGGGGDPDAPPPAPASLPPTPTLAPEPPEPVKPQPIKPPKDERKGLPELDSKVRKKAAPTPPPTAASNLGGTGTGTQTPGLSLGLPPGLGVPEGSAQGDWYMAGVQRRIWMLWMQQIRAEHPQPVTVRFTILADGSVADPQVVQESGLSLIDRAALRAVLSAAPFGPLPKSYGTDRYTIQAVFRPTH